MLCLLIGGIAFSQTYTVKRFQDLPSVGSIDPNAITIYVRDSTSPSSSWAYYKVRMSQLNSYCNGYWTNDGSATWLSDPSQYLGIGNTNPQGRLDVTGSLWNSAIVGGPPSLVTNKFGYTIAAVNDHGFMGMDDSAFCSIQSTDAGIYVFPHSRSLMIQADTIAINDTYGGGSIGYVLYDVDGHGHLALGPPGVTSGWGLTGNSGTTAITDGGPNFIGTTDYNRLNIGANNQVAIDIDQNANITIGQASRDMTFMVVGDAYPNSFLYVNTGSHFGFLGDYYGNNHGTYVIVDDNNRNIAIGAGSDVSIAAATSFSLGIQGSYGQPGQVLVSNGSNASWQNYESHSIINTTLGSTINVNANTYSYVAFTGSSGTLNVGLPPSPVDGDFVELKFSNHCDINYGSATIADAVTSVSSGQAIKYVWDSATSSWY